ncbi:MAG: PhoU domain-containing protein [Planctomycetota bacterium]
MFKWITSVGENVHGMERMCAAFGQMLDEGRHVFVTAANAYLGGTDIEVIRQDLFDTDKRINHTEQQIRREIVIHTTSHGVNSVPQCLVLMSIAKDAERVGDYAKNIFDLAELNPKAPTGKFKEDLISLKDRISTLMVACREVFDLQDEKAARELIAEAKSIEDHCDHKISQLVSEGKNRELGVSYALAYRYFKRVTSHSFNVLTSIVQPLDKLDFSEPGPESRAG